MMLVSKVIMGLGLGMMVVGRNLRKSLESSAFASISFAPILLRTEMHDDSEAG